MNVWLRLASLAQVADCQAGDYRDLGSRGPVLSVTDAIKSACSTLNCFFGLLLCVGNDVIRPPNRIFVESF